MVQNVIPASIESGRAAGTPSLRTNPELCPGSYDLHLYCKYDNSAHAWDEFPWEVGDFQTFGAAVKWARGQGWIYHRDRTATCPKCAKALAGSSPSTPDASKSPGGET